MQQNYEFAEFLLRCVTASEKMGRLWATSMPLWQISEKAGYFRNEFF
jgi:hypothetical protein